MEKRKGDLIIYFISIPFLIIGICYLFFFDDNPIVFGVILFVGPILAVIIHYFIYKPKCSQCGKFVFKWYETLTEYKDHTLCAKCKKDAGVYTIEKREIRRGMLKQMFWGSWLSINALLFMFGLLVVLYAQLTTTAYFSIPLARSVLKIGYVMLICGAFNCCMIFIIYKKKR